MEIVTPEFKSKVAAAIKHQKENFSGGDAKHANSLDINPAVYSQIMAGNYYKNLADAKWISLARVLNINLNNEADWKTAKTPVYEAISAILKKCQKDSICANICDDADVGKTYTAKEYVRTNKNAVYIDCSNAKTKSLLIRAIAKQFGLSHTGRYKDVYADLCFYVGTITRPLIILDEAGDLDGLAELEIKALWNATEKACGWVRMGADGFKEKINRGIIHKKVGYTETHSRYGSRFQRITPEAGKEKSDFAKQQAALIIKANTAEGTDIQKLLTKTNGSLRRIYTEISKL